MGVFVAAVEVEDKSVGNEAPDIEEIEDRRDRSATARCDGRENRRERQQEAGILHRMRLDTRNLHYREIGSANEYS